MESRKERGPAVVAGGGGENEAGLEKKPVLGMVCQKDQLMDGTRRKGVDGSANKPSSRGNEGRGLVGTEKT